MHNFGSLLLLLGLTGGAGLPWPAGEPPAVCCGALRSGHCRHGCADGPARDGAQAGHLRHWGHAAAHGSLGVC
eukprot:1153955-Pelagomonas_calceolata.AAC.4